MSLYNYVEELNKPVSHSPNYLGNKYKRLINANIVLILSLAVFNISAFGIHILNKQQSVKDIGAVQGVQIREPTPTPTRDVTVTVNSNNEEMMTEPTPIIPTPSLSKDEYTIAIIGDSMVDTMGERLEYLEHVLKKKYPKTSFTLYNYGVGSENVEEGLARLGKDFQYKDRTYPPLNTIHPDVLIIGSYAYNPFTPFDRDKHWLKLAEMVQEARKISPKVYLLAEIAPRKKDFGKGPQGIKWEDNVRDSHAQKIITQMENTLGLSRSLHVPLIDAYTQSIRPETGDVNPEFVSASDGIHPSAIGHVYTAEKIVESINLE